MNTLPRLMLATLLVATVTGCVFIDGEHGDTDDWRSAQEDNREAISQLSIGMSQDAVVDRLGTPADSEAFTRDGEEVRVLFYRTRHRHSDGETSRDETTPLVFRNGELIGWGQRVYDTVR
ncbi:MAG: DUF3192 domain-containing protein [Pseudohaliea sp.]